MANNTAPIVRSSMLSHTLYGRAGLLQEIGPSYDHSAVLNVWSSGLARREIGNCNGACTTFVFDKSSQSIVSGLQRSERGITTSSIAVLKKGPNSHLYTPSTEWPRLETRVATMSVSPSRIILATTSQPAAMYSIHLDPFASINCTPVLRFGAGFWDPLGNYLASAANPSQDVCIFAVGTSKKTILLHESEGDWNLQQCHSQHIQQEGAAINWLSSNVVLKGCRDGAVKIWDIRRGKEESTPEIKHPAAVLNVGSFGENRVVVAGLKHQLCTYDLRYTKRIDPDQTTEYYHRFPTYRKSTASQNAIGFDISNNLVAAATDNRSLQVFDVKKGVEVDEGTKRLEKNAACVRFVDEERSGEGLKLMVSAGYNIDELAFEGL